MKLNRNYIDELYDKIRSDEKIAFIEAATSYSITYCDFKDAVWRTEQSMQLMNLNHQSIVVVFLNKSCASIIAMYSIMKAGYIYVPMDIDAPLTKIEAILGSLQPAMIITTKKLFNNFINTFEKFKSTIFTYFEFEDNKYNFLFNQNLSEQISEKHDSSIRVGHNNEKSLSDIAYIIFTSGSSGKPKGVMISHDSLKAFIDTVLDWNIYNDETAFLNVSPFYFDASIMELFVIPAVHGCLITLDKFTFVDRLLSVMDRYKITDTLLISTILRLLASKYGNISKYALPYLKSIWFGGESCPLNVLKIIKEQYPNITFIHGYGPTETTHTATIYITNNLENEYETFLPIGSSLAHIETLVLNENREKVEIGDIGELLIGGRQLMSGYWDNKTGFDGAIIEIDGKKYYKSGDFVKVLRNNNYLYLNRKDDMIKTRGYLVYLSEIENAFLILDNVKDVIIFSEPDELINNKILALVVIKQKSVNDDDIITIRKNLNLPEYMIPSEIHILSDDLICYTTNYKLDKEKILKIYKDEIKTRNQQ